MSGWLCSSGPHEVAEILDMHWKPTESSLPHSKEWKGPMSRENIIKVHSHKVIFLKLTCRSLAGTRKYNFGGHHTLPDGTDLWIYNHCSGTSKLLIRKVKAPLKLQLVLQATDHGL